MVMKLVASSITSSTWSVTSSRSMGSAIREYFCKADSSSRMAFSTLGITPPFLHSCSSRNWFRRFAALNVQIPSRLFTWSSSCTYLLVTCLTCSESSSMVAFIVFLSFLASSIFHVAQDIFASWVMPRPPESMKPRKGSSTTYYCVH